MTTPFFAHTVLLQPLTSLVIRLRSFSRRPHSVVDLLRPTGDADQARVHPAAIEPAISVVHDPDGDLRLVGVRGPVTASSVDTLIDALDDLDDGLGLHLDLSGATIHGSVALRQVEATVDELERRGVKLRVVGVDPAHPALVAESRS